MNVDSTPHIISARYDGHLLIAGFEDIDADSCFCIKAYGHRYHEYGIADESLMYCCKTNAVSDGDLCSGFGGSESCLSQRAKDRAARRGAGRDSC